jgi:DNA mismatch endonuclease (patch repair protein)
MTDVLTKAQRHRCMAQIRGKDTKPECKVRSIIHGLGFRYRLYVDSIKGNPDIVFTRLQKIIFVHGCFWHMHTCKYGRVKPKTNAEFWQAKRQSNRRRDANVSKTLRKEGWSVLNIWECELRNTEELKRKVKAFLTNASNNKRLQAVSLSHIG